MAINRLSRNKLDRSFLYWGLSAVSTVFVAILGLACFRGLDMTDEGFYLNWLARPEEYHASVSQFGYLYTAWFRFLGESVPLIRVFNVAVTFGLGWFVFDAVARAADRPMRVAVGLVGGAVALGGFDIHLLTPNYNTLNLQGLLLFAAGFLYWEGSSNVRRKLFAEFLVALGGVLVFLAKPTTALLLAGVFLAAHFAIGRRDYARVLRVTFWTVGLSCVTAFLIDGSLGLFIERYQTGLAMVRSQGADHGMFTLAGAFGWRLFLRVFGLGVALWLVLAVCRDWKELGGKRDRTWRLGVRAAPLTLAVLTVGFCASPMVRQFFDMSRGKQHLLGLFLATSLVLPLKKDRRHVTLAVLFLLLPFVFANGTANGTWFATGLVDVFWFAGAMLLALAAISTPHGRRVAVAVMALGLVLLGARLATGWKTPYRQPDELWSYNRELAGVDRIRHLKLADLTADYLETALVAISESGFTSGGAVLDFSGQSPGLVFAAGGISPGQPWNLRGYPGSKERLRIALMTVGCEKLVSSWIIMHDDPTLGFKEDSMRAVGLDFGDYKKEGTWPALDYGGKMLSGSQSFYAPLGDPADRTKKCEGLRHELDTAAKN